MLAAVFFFSCMNALTKHLGAHYPVVQVVFFRCLFALIPILAMIAFSAGWRALKTQRLKGHVVRSLTGTISIILFVFSLRFLPLAGTSALFFSGPLFVVLFSILFLKEQVGWHRWAAVILGFGGVLVVLQTGLGATDLTGAMLALGSAVFYAFAMIGVRALGATEASATTAFYFMALSVLMLAPILPFIWQAPVNVTDGLLFIATGFAGGLGQLTMTRAFQCAPASVISPFGYAGLLWATLFGFVIWGEIPAASVFLGGGLIIVAGVYLGYRETRRES